jgi:periplasmic protein TonB
LKQYLFIQKLNIMKPDYILNANVLDIIFEKRNKDYGAYSLRKYYPERLYKSLGIIFFLAAVLGLIGYFQKNEIAVNIAMPDTAYGFVEIPKDPATPPKKPVQQIVPPVTSSRPAAPRPVVTTNGTGTIVFAKDAGKIPDFDPEPAGNQGLPPGTGPVSGGPGAPPAVAPGSDIVKPTDKNIVVSNADVMPAYPGGEVALRRFLERNLKNPKDMDTGEEVSVKIKFIVGYDGVLKGFETIEDGGALFNDEVIRVLKKMPAWIPGKAHGENVSVIYCIPVKFTARD